jgi:hypothetical protein
MTPFAADETISSGWTGSTDHLRVRSLEGLGPSLQRVEVGGHRRRFLACRPPGARRQAQDHADWPVGQRDPVELSDDALATLRESPSNVVRNAEADAGGVSASGGHATVVRRSEPRGPPSPPLEGKWELITDAAGGKPCSLRPLSSGRPRRTDFDPDPVDRWPSDPPEFASATVGAATWPRRLIMRMLRMNRTAVGSGVSGGRS